MSTMPEPTQQTPLVDPRPREPQSPPVPPVEPVAFWWAVLTVACGLLAGIGFFLGIGWVLVAAYPVGVASAVALALTAVRAARALDELVRRSVGRR